MPVSLNNLMRCKEPEKFVYISSYHKAKSKAKCNVPTQAGIFVPDGVSVV